MLANVLAERVAHSLAHLCSCRHSTNRECSALLLLLLLLTQHHLQLEGSTTQSAARAEKRLLQHGSSALATYSTSVNNNDFIGHARTAARRTLQRLVALTSDCSQHRLERRTKCGTARPLLLGSDTCFCFCHFALTCDSLVSAALDVGSPRSRREHHSVACIKCM